MVPKSIPAHNHLNSDNHVNTVEPVCTSHSWDLRNWLLNAISLKILTGHGLMLILMVCPSKSPSCKEMAIGQFNTLSSDQYFRWSLNSANLQLNGIKDSDPSTCTSCISVLKMSEKMHKFSPACIHLDAEKLQLQCYHRLCPLLYYRASDRMWRYRTAC